MVFHHPLDRLPEGPRARGPRELTLPGGATRFRAAVTACPSPARRAAGFLPRFYYPLARCTGSTSGPSAGKFLREPARAGPGRVGVYRGHVAQSRLLW